MVVAVGRGEGVNDTLVALHDHIDVLTQPLLAQYGRAFAQGEILFAEGSPAADLFLLHAGRVRLLKRVRTVERSVEVLGSGHVFGEGALLEGSVRSSTAVAMTEGIAVALDRTSVRTVLPQYPALSERVLVRFAQRLRDAEDHIEVLLLGDAQSKVIRALLGIAGARRSADLAVSPLELATRVGLDVDTVKRAVQRLRDQQYVTIVQERVSIPDLDALQRLYNLLGAKEEVRRSPRSP